MVERKRLESVRMRNHTVGSNPTLSVGNSNVFNVIYSNVTLTARRPMPLHTY